jgi:hypothetical protein
MVTEMGAAVREECGDDRSEERGDVAEGLTPEGVSYMDVW